MMKPTEPLRVVSSGLRRGSSATGRGKEETPSSQGDITSEAEVEHSHLTLWRVLVLFSIRNLGLFGSILFNDFWFLTAAI